MRLPRLPVFPILERLMEAGLLLVLPLVFSRSFAEQFTYPKSLLAQVLVICGFALCALEFAWGIFPWPQDLRPGAPLGMLAIAVLLSTVNSPVPRFSLQESVYFLCGPVWALLLVSWNRDERAPKRLATLAALAGIAVAVIAVLQWTGYDPLLFRGYRIDWGTMAARMRVYSTFGNPNFVAGYLIGTVFLAIGLGASASKRGTRSLWWAAAALMLAAILGAGSRGAWAGLAVGLLVMGLVWKPWLQAAPIRAADHPGESDREVKLATLVTPVLLGFMLIISSGLNQTLLGRIEGRTYLWRVSWPMFAEHPFFGSGWATYQLRYLELQRAFLGAHPEWTQFWTNNRLLHNDPLQLALETGLLGLAAFGWLLWTYGHELQGVLRAAQFPFARLWLGAGTAGLAAMLVDSLFNFQFAVPPTFVLIFTLLAFPFLIRILPCASAASSAQPHREIPTTSSRPHIQEALHIAKPTRGTMDSVRAKRRYGMFALRLLASLAILGLAADLLITKGRQALAERDYLAAKALENRAELNTAEAVYRRGLARNPLNGRLHFGLARVLYKRGSNKESLCEAQLAERTYADSHTWVLKGYIQRDLGRPQQALATFRHAVALDPTLTIAPVEIEKLERELTEGTSSER